MKRFSKQPKLTVRTPVTVDVVHLCLRYSKDFCFSSFVSHSIAIGVDSGEQPGHVPPIIKLGGQNTFYPNNSEDSFLKILKTETREKEIKYCKKLIENSH